MKMPLIERFQRFFGGVGNYGIYRSPKRANLLHTAEISVEMQIMSGMLKRSGLVREIEEEKYQIKKDFEEFHKKFTNKEYHTSNAKMDEAKRINDEFTTRIKNLQEKMVELSEIKTKIKDFNHQKVNIEKEFENEMELHRIRFDEDIEKGRI